MTLNRVYWTMAKTGIFRKNKYFYWF